ncbi:MAG: lysine transporter LysE [SAR86 cluster bacterium]|uniref:Lysine transporter LysE n=1 Tax=SAR86 cluster bacterium TaxID=2030880 RepID=A0A2A4X8D2_9GAMM|nr:MAG: lysine transporter LysE [SAR86 cluster bacterium]
MELGQIISFLTVSAVFIAVPGPNVLVIVSTTIVSGKLRGLQTVAGTSLAMIVQLTIAALGTSLLLSTLSQGLIWLKWCGVVYLLFLGINSLYAFFTHKKSKHPSAADSMQRGFWVSLTNPKTIIFFSAFLPQFANADSAYLPQIAILSGSFLLLAVTIDCTYAISSTKLKWFLASKDIDRVSNGVSGAFFIGAGGLLANTNRV